jgi:hypothetical protein
MKGKPPEVDSWRADYEAAVAEERLLWRSVNDLKLSPGDRLTAYARWRAAADRVKVLGAKLRFREMGE